MFNINCYTKLKNYLSYNFFATNLLLFAFLCCTHIGGAKWHRHNKRNRLNGTYTTKDPCLACFFSKTSSIPFSPHVPFCFDLPYSIFRALPSSEGSVGTIFIFIVVNRAHANDFRIERSCLPLLNAGFEPRVSDTRNRPLTNRLSYGGSSEKNFAAIPNNVLVAGE